MFGTAPLRYSAEVSSLFRRKSTDLVEDATASVNAEAEAAASRPKSYTPSKKELGVATPKRSTTGRRVNEPAPENRRAAYKQMRARQRVERAEASAGMRAGDPRYMLARDRGPERELVRNIVDSRRTVGTWFFGGAVIVLIGSSTKMPVQVQLFANLLWAVLAIAVVVDSFLIARRIRKLVNERFPQTSIRMSSLCFYGIMRGLSFRRMRAPKPAVALGAKI